MMKSSKWVRSCLNKLYAKLYAKLYVKLYKFLCFVHACVYGNNIFDFFDIEILNSTTKLMSHAVFVKQLPKIRYFFLKVIQVFILEIS